jgi:hypothetical protein
MKAPEIEYLRDHYRKSLALFYKTMRSLAVICFLIPTVVWLFYGLFNSKEEEAKALLEQDIRPYTVWYYLASVLFLFCLIGIGAYFGYLKPMQQQKRDIREGMKIIERARIIRKQAIAGRSFYLFLDSAIKLNIEVGEKDFNLYHEGDEVNIEYSRYARFYLGYF